MIYPKGTLDYDFYRVDSKYMTEVGARTSLYVQNVNISDVEVRYDLTELYNIFENDNSVVHKMSNSWFEAFKLNVGNYSTMPDEDIFDSLILWLNDTGRIYMEDVILDLNEKMIKSCRFNSNHVKRIKSNEQVNY